MHSSWRWGPGDDIRSFGIIGEPAKNYIGYTVGHDEGGRAGLSGPKNKKAPHRNRGTGCSGAGC